LLDLLMPKKYAIGLPLREIQGVVVEIVLHSEDLATLMAARSQQHVRHDERRRLFR